MKLDFITQEEAQTIRRTMPKTKIQEEYEGYLRQLPDGHVGKIVVALKDNVKPQTVRSRLNKAGKSLKLEIQTRRVGNVVLFWNENK
jgi:hypothetical protein